MSKLETRVKILTAIRSASAYSESTVALTASQIASRLDLHPSTVRRHLAEERATPTGSDLKISRRGNTYLYRARPLATTDTDPGRLEVRVVDALTGTLGLFELSTRLGLSRARLQKTLSQLVAEDRLVRYRRKGRWIYARKAS